MLRGFDPYTRRHIMKTIAIFLIAHFVGDFVFQRDVWAKTKSSSNVALTKHLAVYTATLMAFSFLVFGVVHGGATRAVTFALVNGSCHWVTDYFTSRWASRLYRANRIHDFFVVVGLDQLIHYLTLLIVFWFIR